MKQVDYEALRPYLVRAFYVVSKEFYGLNFSTLEIELEKRLGAVHLDQAILYMSEWHSIPLMEFCIRMLHVAQELLEKDKSGDGQDGEITWTRVQ